MHFKIPNTVFYPKPKVESCLIGLHFAPLPTLRARLAGVDPRDLRLVVTKCFQQRRKCVRNSLKKLLMSELGGDKERVREMLESEPLPLPDAVARLREEGDEVAREQELPGGWAGMRPEELTPGQFVELTRLCLGERAGEGRYEGKVWRKVKHGS